MKIRVLFVIPPGRDWNGKILPLKFPHIGVGYLSACLKERGIHDIKVFDVSLDLKNKYDNLLRLINTFQPNIIGLTLYSQLVNEGRDIVSEIRKATSSPIVVGGPHISATKEEFLKETSVEYGIMKDGEIPLFKLISALFLGGNRKDLLNIPGLIFRDEDGNFIVQENTDLIYEMDKLPMPDWSVFNVNNYSWWSDGRFQLLTSRGCPYDCTYCAAPVVTGREFRMRSAKNVVDEIELYVKRGFTKFVVGDDAFNINLNRAKEVCKLIIERNLKVSWDLGNGLRANIIDRELFQLLKKAGCNFIGFGLESGNEEMLKKIKKQLKIEDMYKALEFAKEVGIGTAVNIIIGHPGETYECAMDSLRLAKRLPASYVNIYNLMPMKGTEAYYELKQAEKKGMATFFYEHDYYLSHFSSQSIEPLFETPEFTREQRKKILVMGRNITKLNALRYRFGKVTGNILYILLRNDKVFVFFNWIRSTPLGEKIYLRIRRED